ncbi:hypothetical protein Mapa_017689 [Marchantia paleacea]|nr:hypothetical protein Mapa_017689 [Marchantia paleacea]
MLAGLDGPRLVLSLDLSLAALPSPGDLPRSRFFDALALALTLSLPYSYATALLCFYSVPGERQRCCCRCHCYCLAAWTCVTGRPVQPAPGNLLASRAEVADQGREGERGCRGLRYGA